MHGTAVSNDYWITITSGRSGTGNGTVNYSVAANDTCIYRSGSITIAGQGVSIYQEGNATISPTSANFSAPGGTGAVAVTADSTCAWTAVSNDYWITITSGRSGTGNGTVNYSVTDTCVDRTGSITIAGQEFSIYQHGTATISPPSASFSSLGGTGAVAVTADSTCAWTAVSNDYWITITSGRSGTGNGTVNYSVTDTCVDRTGSITIAGQEFSIYQEGTATISPPSANFSAPGGTGSVAVTADSTCAWTAVSNDAWIRITSGASSTGTGVVNYSVSANTGGARDGTLTVAGQTVTIHQESECTYAINPTNASYSAAGDTGSVNVTADSGCKWTAVSNVSWITITSGDSGTGNGSVGYSISVNTGPARDGTMTIAGQTLTIHQDGSYTVTVKQTGSGTVIFVPPGPYAPGQKVLVYIEPAPGSGVLDVIVDGVSIGPIFTITFADMSESHTIEVIFG